MMKRPGISRKIALRLSTQNSAASWSRPVIQIATIGVAVGIALIVLSTAIVHGFQQEVKELVVGFGSDVQILNANHSDPKIVRNYDLEKQVLALEEVDSVHPFYLMPAILESKTGVKGVLGKGLSSETSHQLLGRFLQAGTTAIGEEGAVLSSEQANRLGIGLGDRFTVYLVGGPSGVRARNLVLEGIYRTGLLEYDEEFMFLPSALIQQSAGWGLELQLVMDSANVEVRSYGTKTIPLIQWYVQDESGGWMEKEFFRGNKLPWGALSRSNYLITASGRNGEEMVHSDSIQLYQNDEGRWDWERMGGGWRETASGLEVFLIPGAEIWEAEQKIFEMIPLGMQTETVLQQAPEMFTWLGMLDLNVEIIIGLMVLISIINMTSALLILILERRPMVGMLKALGMTDGQIMRIFFWKSVRILGRGFLLGNFFGVLVVALQATTGWLTLNPEAYYLDVVPVRMNWVYLMAIELVAFMSCAVMMWLPSLVSTRIHPAEALRINR
ncbi:MAG: ABC transporter permease [Flavobacteriales bacterium]